MGVHLHLQNFSGQDFGTMATKQLKQSLYTPDGSYYACLTDGSGTLVTIATAALGGTKQAKQSLYAPDGSWYLTLTDGNGNLV